MPTVSGHLCPSSRNHLTVVEENPCPAHMASNLGDVIYMTHFSGIQNARVMVVVSADISKESLRSGSVWTSSQGELWSCKNEI